MSNRKWMILLTMMGALTALSIDIYLPSMPHIAQSLGSNIGRVQLSLSVFVWGFAVGQLFFGSISDALGRRNPLLFGLGLYLAANLFCAAAPSMDMLILGRFLQGLGACCGAVSCQAIARDRFHGRELTRLLAQLATAVGLAPMAAPIIGANLDAVFGWRASFAFLTLFSLILFIWVFKSLPETRAKQGQVRWSAMPGEYLRLLVHPVFLSFSLLNGFAFGALFAFISGSSGLFIEGFGVTPRQYAFMFGSNALMFMLGSYITSILAKRINPAGLGIIGALAIAFGGGFLLLLSGNPGPMAVLLPMYLLTIGVAISLAAGSSGALNHFGPLAGRASALQGFIRFALAAVASLFMGEYAEHGMVTLAWCTFICGVVALAAACFGKQVEGREIDNGFGGTVDQAAPST